MSWPYDLSIKQSQEDVQVQPGQSGHATLQFPPLFTHLSSGERVVVVDVEVVEVVVVEEVDDVVVVTHAPLLHEYSGP